MKSAAGTDIPIRTVTLADGRTLSYRLTRKKMKNAYFRPKADGIIDVSANPRMTIAQIERFIADRAQFFFKAFAEIARKEESRKTDNTVVRWLGSDYPVRIIESLRECAVLESDECRVFTRHPDEENIALLIRRMTEQRFAELCRQLNEEVRAALQSRGLNPPPTRITIKDMSSRWGSCSYNRGHISINIRLAPFPRETVLSVLWHEYAHYWHHDHSKAFYAFLQEHYPDYHKWNGLLK